MPTRNDVYVSLDTEREYQIKRWGVETQASQPVASYLTFIQHYMNEATREITKNPDNRFVMETIRKITALGVACMEQHGAPQRVN